MDTKGRLFYFLQAAEELIDRDYVPECGVYLANSCTEEIGGRRASLTVKWIQDNEIQLRFLIDEGGMIKKEPMRGEGVFCHGRLSGQRLWRYPFHCKRKWRTCQFSPEADTTYTFSGLYNGY